jgi:hypothetical protein
MSLKEIEKGKEITGNIIKELDKRFLSSLDLIGHSEITLTIDRVEKHDLIKYENGNTDKNVLLLYFVETPKPLKLVKTNIAVICQRLKTNKVADWKGKKIKLVAKEVKAFGEMKLAVRVI